MLPMAEPNNVPSCPCAKNSQVDPGEKGPTLTAPVVEMCVINSEESDSGSPSQRNVPYSVPSRAGSSVCIEPANPHCGTGNGVKTPARVDVKSIPLPLGPYFVVPQSVPSAASTSEAHWPSDAVNARRIAMEPFVSA